MAKKLKFRSGVKLGKYQLRHKLGQGAFGDVWKAEDSVEGIGVALKIPYPQFMSPEYLEAFRREARLLGKLDHPHILRIKTAEFIDGHLIIASELGHSTLEKLLKRALPLKRSLNYFSQALEALAHAHEQKIMHRDIKPENFIIFGKEHLRLADFGIAKILERKSGTTTTSGTIGYMAPEQAYGRPTMASDVFSAGLLLWRMLSGVMADWPFTWPFTGYEILQKKTPASLENFIRKACAFKPEDRFANAIEMKTHFDKLLPRILKEHKHKKTKKKTRKKPKKIQWEPLRHREFERHYRKTLDLHYTCRDCHGPISESMSYCPWCKSTRNRFDQITDFPDSCENCRRGVKKEWRYCPWCFGPRFKTAASKITRDKRYTHTCDNKKCPVGWLMPFMRYCPWCHKKTKKAGQIPTLGDKCPKCHWSVARGYWEFCPWCSEPLRQGPAKNPIKY